MHIEFLLEEASAEAALMKLLPRMLPTEVTYRLHPFGGKGDLLSNLGNRLKGYAHWMPDDYIIVVLIDEDRQDCRDLKARLERAAEEAGLHTRSRRGADGKFQVINRVAVEELEAWFFGDVPALAAAYPGVSATLGQKRGYRDPDTIGGGTWEALERILQAAGYYSTGLPKLEAARRIAEHMDPDHNRSQSFCAFRDALRQLSSA